MVSYQPLLVGGGGLDAEAEALGLLALTTGDLFCHDRFANIVLEPQLEAVPVAVARRFERDWGDKAEQCQLFLPTTLEHVMRVQRDRLRNDPHVARDASLEFQCGLQSTFSLFFLHIGRY